MKIYNCENADATSIVNATFNKFYDGNNAVFPDDIIRIIRSANSNITEDQFFFNILKSGRDYPFQNIVNFMSSVTYIRSCAFMNNKTIYNATFPQASLINEHAFEFCTNISEASFPLCENIHFSAFCYCASLQTISFPECTAIGSNAFAYCSALSSVFFPKCKKIYNGAFVGCINLSDVLFPECEEIYNGAFQACSNLSTIGFTKCSHISVQAFYNCSNLQKVILISTATIDYHAFALCQRLYGVYLLGSSMCSISNNTVFYGTPISDSFGGVYGSIYVPSSLVSAYKTDSYWSYYSERIIAYSGRQ